MHLDKNEYCPQFVRKPKIEPTPDVGKGDDDSSDEDNNKTGGAEDEEEASDEETEEEFDWYNPLKMMDETYFVYVN